MLLDIYRRAFLLKYHRHQTRQIPMTRTQKIASILSKKPIYTENPTQSSTKRFLFTTIQESMEIVTKRK